MASGNNSGSLAPDVHSVDEEHADAAESFPLGEWTFIESTGAFPGERHWASTAVAGNDIFVFGGFSKRENSNKFHGDFFKFDTGRSLKRKVSFRISRADNVSLGQIIRRLVDKFSLLSLTFFLYRRLFIIMLTFLLYLSTSASLFCFDRIAHMDRSL